MKKNIFFCLLLITSISFAQERIISGIIKDANSKVPINSASISIAGTNMGTISNEEGEFRIIVPEQYSILNLYHISYSTSEYEIKEDSKIEILLAQKVYLLDEVAINKNKEDKHKAENLLRETIVATKKKTDTTILMHTYYREISKVDGHYTSYSDGILDFYNYFKNAKWTRNRINSDLFIKQSRVFDLRNSRQMDLLSPITVQDAIKDGYDLDWLEFGILKHRKKYTFQVESKTEEQGKGIDIIYINPKEGVKEYLYTGSITRDSKTKLILEIDLKLTPELKQYAKMINFIFGKAKMNDWAMKSSFRINDDKYILSYCLIRQNIYMKFGKILDNTIESVHDLTVLDYEEGKFNYDKTKKYQKILLFENGNSYTEEFWKKQNVKLLSETEENIIKTLNPPPQSRETLRHIFYLR